MKALINISVALYNRVEQYENFNLVLLLLLGMPRKYNNRRLGLAWPWVELEPLS